MKLPDFLIRYFSLFILIIFLFSSCYKDLMEDFDKSVEVVYDGTWAASIVHTEVSLSDFSLTMDDESEVKIEDLDNVLVLTYNTTKLYSLRGEHLYHPDLETINFSFDITGPNPTGPSKIHKANYNYTFTENVKLDMGGMIVDSALMKSGTLVININSNINFPYALTLKSNYVLDENKQTLNMSKYPSSGGTSFSIDLKDKEIIMPYGQNSIPLTFEIELIPGSSTVNCPYSFNANNSLSSCSFYWLHGQPITKEEYLSQNLMMQFIAEKSILKLKAHEAKINLEVRNNVGMPLSLRVDTLILCNDADNFYAPLINITELLTARYPAVKGEYATTYRTFDIENFTFDNKNTYIQFRGTGILNHNGIDGNKYFITDSSRYRIHARVEVPLKIDLHQFSYLDTIPFPFSMDSVNVEQLESALFRIHITNSFAFGIKNQIYFLNDTYQVVDSLFDKPLVLSKAIVDPENDYHLLQSITSSQDVTVTNQRLERITKAPYMLIKAEANVNKDDPYMIFYYDEQKLGIKVGVKAHIKTQLEISSK